jgi:hypothetical protein
MKGKTTCPQCKHKFVMDVPDDSDTHTIKCPQCNHLFAIKRTCHEKPDDECGWEEYGEPRKTILSSIRKKTSKPIITSFLLLASGVLGIFYAVILALSDGSVVSHFGVITSYFSTVDNAVLSIPLIISSAFVFVGSVNAFKRRYFIFTAVCAVVGIFSVVFFIGFVLSIVALTLLIISRDEYENAAKGKLF